MSDLSIITVCYNAAEELNKTIQSILSQTDLGDLRIEHLIIDNLSTDNTSKLVDNYKKTIEGKNISIYFVSEADKGIYDAMNKGLKLASCEWGVLLNAGDTFYSNMTLCELKAHFSLKADILVGYYNRLNPSGDIIVRPPSIEKLKDRMIFCHQALVFRIQAHRGCNYNLKYRIVADYDVVLRMYLSKKVFEYIDVCLVNYDVTGLSAARMIDTHKEMYLVRKKNDIIDDKFKAEILFRYGLFKRLMLKVMPQSIRWKMVGFRDKHFKKKYL